MKRTRRQPFDKSNAVLCGAVLATLLSARGAQAASLQQITDFGANPSKIKMFLYVPDKLVSAKPPVLVGVHWCHGDAQAFFTGTGFRALADQYGFIVVYPSAVSSDGCWDVHSTETLAHDGGGDSLGIVSMVKYVLQRNSADAQRVYVTGHSSGGMMTNVLLGAYPDVFRAGAAFAGVPFGCFRGADTWNTACATGTISKSGMDWGNGVRGAFPGYTGLRPRVQLFHGTTDDTLSFKNFGEEIKLWTNVLGVSETPTTTEQNKPEAPFVRTRYSDAGGVVRVEAVKEEGQPHNLKILAAEAVHFFGLDAKDDPVPLPNGSGGAAGAGGNSNSAGGAGGNSNSAGGTSSGGGASSTGGKAGSPSELSGGTSGSGGTSSSAGGSSPSEAGTNSTPLGGSASGGTGSPQAGASTTGGAPTGSAGSAAAGSATAPGATPPAADDDASEGCAMSPGAARSQSAWALALAGLAMFLGRRRHQRKIAS